MFQFRSFASLAVSVSVFVLGAQGAFAGPGNLNGGKNFNISWEEFKGRCTDANSYDNQRSPREIRIQCTNVEREYVPDAPGSIELGSGRHVITTVLSDKFNVAALDKVYPLSVKSSSCLRYKEIEKSITIERPLSCADVLGVKGEINDYCASALEMAKGANPKLIDVHETGAKVDSCDVSAAGGKSK